MPFIILICGASCAGKTYLSNYVKSIFPNKVTHIGLDAYCIDHGDLSVEEIKQINYDHPSAYDGVLLAKHINQLKSGKSVHAPIYDFVTHHRKKETTIVNPNEIIIVEGILTFQYPELFSLADLRVFVDASEDVCFSRRVYRDKIERGRNEESIRYQYFSTVLPMKRIYIDSVKDKADMILTNNSNNGPLPMASELINKLKGILS